jgi:hypothetical protein
LEIRYLLFSENGYVEPSQQDLSLPWLVAPNLPHPNLRLGDVFHTVANEIKNLIPGDLACLSNFTPLVIKSEKHGPFYHIFSIGDLWRSLFCVSIAHTSQGKNTLKEDFYNLKALRDKIGPFIPRCYGLREITLDGSTEPLLMGVFEWLDGYHELHACKAGETLYFELWSPAGYQALSQKDVLNFFKNTSKILFLCCSPDTHERLSPWTHITGDFVFNPDSTNPYQVKLTTVRGLRVWANLPSDPHLRSVYAALLWLLETLLINRVDRERGVGELLLLPPFVLKATLEVILDECQRYQAFCTAYALLKHMDLEELRTLYEIVLDELDLNSEVERFLRDKIQDHLQDLLTLMRS